MSTPVDLFVGKRIKMLRERKGLSVDNLAAGLGLTVQEIHHIELGAVRATVRTLLELSRLYDVPLTEFFQSSSKAFEEILQSGFDESQRGFAGHDDLLRLVMAFDAIREADSRQTVLDLAEVLARSRVN